MCACACFSVLFCVLPMAFGLLRWDFRRLEWFHMVSVWDFGRETLVDIVLQALLNQVVAIVFDGHAAILALGLDLKSLCEIHPENGSDRWCFDDFRVALDAFKHVKDITWPNHAILKPICTM